MVTKHHERNKETVWIIDVNVLKKDSAGVTVRDYFPEAMRVLCTEEALWETFEVIRTIMDHIADTDVVIKATKTVDGWSRTLQMDSLGG